MSDDDLTGVKARYFDREGREIARDYFNDNGPSRDVAELRLLDLISFYDTVIASWPKHWKDEGAAPRAVAEARAMFDDVRAGSLDPDRAIHIADRLLLKAARGFLASFIREQSLYEERVQSKQMVTPLEWHERAVEFWRLMDNGVSRNDAYRRVTGRDATKQPDQRFVDACGVLRRPWPQERRGPPKGSKQTKARKYKTHGADHIDNGGRKTRR